MTGNAAAFAALGLATASRPTERRFLGSSAVCTV